MHAAADGIAMGAAATTAHHEVEIIVFLAIMLHKVIFQSQFSSRLFVIPSGSGSGGIWFGDFPVTRGSGIRNYTCSSVHSAYVCLCPRICCRAVNELEYENIWSSSLLLLL